MAINEALLFILSTHRDDFYSLLVPNVVPALTSTQCLDMGPLTRAFVGVDTIRSGSAIFNLCLSCKRIYDIFLPLINKDLIFRCKNDGPYVYYSPSRITFMSANSSLSPLTSPNEIIIGTGVDQNLSLDIPSTVTKLSMITCHPINIKLPNNLTHLETYPFTLSYSKLDLPPHLTHLSLVLPVGRQLPILPNSISHLTIHKIDTLIPSFPPSLIYLELQGEIQSLPPFPPSLIHLDIDTWKVIRSLPPFPSKLLHLKVSCCSESTPFTTVPPSLLSLSFPYRFKEPVTFLPPQLTTLKCAYECNITCPLPSSLRHLSLPYQINKPISSLPPLLTHLQFPTDFKSSDLTCSLPPTLTNLTIHFNSPQIQDLHSLEMLCIGVRMEDDSHVYLPPSIHHLSIRSYTSPKRASFDPLPSITRLILGYSCEVTILPPFLEQLTLDDIYNDPLPPLPSTLTHITIDQFTHPLPPLPDSLSKLCFTENEYNFPLPKLPEQLRHLHLAPNYNFELPNVPRSLFILQCCDVWMKKFSPALPPACIAYMP